MKGIAFIIFVLFNISVSLAHHDDVFAEAYNRHYSAIKQEYEARKLRPFNGTNPFIKITPQARRIGMEGKIIQRVAEELGITAEEAIMSSERQDVPCPIVNGDRVPVGRLRDDGLDYDLSCNSRSEEFFRRSDGTCNNLDNPHWGSNSVVFRRLFENTYADGRSEPTPNLPNVRLVSTTIHPDVSAQDLRLTNMLMQVGQFIDHDMSLAPEIELECCGHDLGDEECANIMVPPNDPFYSFLSNGPECLPIRRSIPICSNTDIREHFNAITAFMDLSNIYGSSEEILELLRDPEDPALLLEGQSFPGALPTVFEATNDEHFEGVRGTFISGDIRVNEQPGLAVMHTLFLREHNRLAREIRNSNPHLEDDWIFNLARRINAAEWQQVVYGEFLPTTVGPDLANRFLLDTFELDSSYFSRFNPSVLHSVATAVFRFGHTLVNGEVQKYLNGQPSSSFSLRENFFNSDEITVGNGDGFERILDGLINQPALAFDEFLTEELTNHLFQEEANDFGEDLVARNLQRGREHGIASYADYRDFCGLGPEFTDEWAWSKPDEISDELWAQLETVYDSPRDIDLFTGGLVETPNSRAVVGPTFGCLISYQYFLIKAGDRFFYTHRCGQDLSSSLTFDTTLQNVLENGRAENFVRSFLRRSESSECGLERFTPEERNEISQRSLGDIICDNSDTIDSTTEYVMLVASIGNRDVPCQGRRPLDLSVFQM